MAGEDEGEVEEGVGRSDSTGEQAAVDGGVLREAALAVGDRYGFAAEEFHGVLDPVQGCAEEKGVAPVFLANFPGKLLVIGVKDLDRIRAPGVGPPCV